MRREIEFPSNGLTCRGWLYVPDSSVANKPAPAIVMAHGFSAVKEMFRLSKYAERFEEAGFVTLVFDFRFLGASDGEPRGQIISHEQQDDYRNAITWLSRQPEVDEDRIGVWGTSYSGGHVLHLAAFDPRIKAVVAQVPTICPWRQIVHRSGQDGLDRLLGMLTADRVQQFETGIRNSIKVVGLQGELSALSVPDAYEAMMRNAEIAPNWINSVTMESLENYVGYHPTASIELISPTPLIMILAEKDSLIPVELARTAFDRAGEPKELHTFPCGHFEVYETEPWFTKAVSSMADWYTKYL
ncbi:MAG: alpha/beta hydrolase [Chloroflexi bacterium]|nr:alpha/beta hydrolase [Chloroflexota bacterium]